MALFSNTLGTNQNEVLKTVFIYRKMDSISKRYWDHKPVDKEERDSIEEFYRLKEIKGYGPVTEDTFLIEKVLKHASL